MQANQAGYIFYLTIICFTVIFPTSIPRELGQLGHISILGLVANILLTLVIVFELFSNHQVVTNINKNFEMA